MPAARFPSNEHSRQALLEALGILDTAPEDDYQDVVRIASEICGVKTAVISLVDSKRQWFKARVGLDSEEMPREVSFCAHAILEPEQVLEVGDARNDARFADNPLVTQGGVCFYAGAPVLVDGLPVGTVCVVDERPRQLTPGQSEALAALARQAARLMELRRLGRMMNIQLRERDWYERNLMEKNRILSEGGTSAAWDARRVDLLTGLPGEGAFEELADEEIWLRQGSGNPLHVAVMEIDDLESVRAMHGTDATNELLGTLARILRSAQVVEGRVARVGSGFAVLMPVGLSQAIGQCVRVGDLMGNAASGIPVTLSVGIASVDAEFRGADVLECALHALAQARGSGGNRVEVR